MRVRSSGADEPAWLAAGDEVVIYSERELNESARIKVVSQLVGQPK